MLIRLCHLLLLVLLLAVGIVGQAEASFLFPPGEGATPLPITHENAARAVTVLREPITPTLRAELEEQQATMPEMMRGSLEGMRYCYRVHYRDWNGGCDETQTYVSARAYAQGYACGEVLLLTNSGAERTPMALALIVSGKPEQEVELHAEPFPHRISGLSPSKKAVPLWHLREGWQSGKNGVQLQLGENHFDCPITWFYDRETGETRFEGNSSMKEGTVLREAKQPLRSIGMGELGASGSSLHQPEDVATPTPGAEEVPTTHRSAAYPLRVECLELPAPAAADDESAPIEDKFPRYRYIVRSCEFHGRQLSFISRYRYGQAFASGHQLLLSTSGAHTQFHDDVTAFIVLGLAAANAQEDVLQFEGLDSFDVCSGQSFVNWDGVDDEGNWIGGHYSYRYWHRAEAISASEAGISVRLGGNIPNTCPYAWEYDAASGQTRLRHCNRLAFFHPLPAHHCTELPLEILDAEGKNNVKTNKSGGFGVSKSLPVEKAP